MAFAVTLGDASSAGGTSILVDTPASIALNDLLITHFSSEVSITTLSGWTLIKTANPVAQLTGAAYFKVAQAGDVGATGYTWTTASGQKGARLYRITGHDTASPIGASEVGSSANSSTVTVGTITPVMANSLFIFLVSTNPAGSAASVSGYTMATSSPSYTEQYDERFDTDNYLLAGAMGVRTAATATGSNTATLSATDPNVGIVIAVTPEVINVTVSPAVLNLSLSIQAPTVTASAVVSPAVLNLTLSIQSPTVTIAAAKWVNTDKNSSSWANTDKS